MVKTVFKVFTIENPLQKNRLCIRLWGPKFLQAIFNGKNFEFSKIVFAIRFLRLWKNFLAGVQIFFQKFLKKLIPSLTQ